MNELQVRLCPVDQLVPYQKNARTHSEEQIAQIAASIQEFGWTNPILVGPDLRRDRRPRQIGRGEETAAD